MHHSQNKKYDIYSKFKTKRTAVPVEIETCFQLYELVTGTILEYIDM